MTGLFEIIAIFAAIAAVAWASWPFRRTPMDRVSDSWKPRGRNG